MPSPFARAFSWQNRIAALVFASGFCALVYQSAWLRLLRLVFGVSTAASAAVLAIFMGGLGLGGWVYGRRADRSPSPLGLYASLEIGVTLGAAASPFLIDLTRALYLATGGTATLGQPLAIVVRLILSAIVLGLPCFQMGGTLPAVARAVERSSDTGRRAVGWVYAANTLGAVLGAVVATFVLFELIGIRNAVWAAAALNLAIAATARRIARSATAADLDGAGEIEAVTSAAVASAREDATEGTSEAAAGGRHRTRFILAASAAVGFVFFLMELVWYRMLGPILGGSSYTFGLILATALLGIGAGGLLYSLGPEDRRPSLGSFAWLCALEAACIALPFAAGDQIAAHALLLRSLGSTGFGGFVTGWAVVTAVVVLPASLVAGYQFPVLVALLGRGGRDVGRQVGLAYAWNTAGAIVGSLAGGFGLIPALGATGVWRLCAVLLVGLALAALTIEVATSGHRRRVLPAAVAAALAALLLCTARGPTGAWRHGSIGAGRAQLPADATPNQLRENILSSRRQVLWEADGVESSVAVSRLSGYAILVNGKSDGHCRNDAPTQVMGGLIGAILHPHPTRAMVVGLGTGSSAGWLAQVGSMERVDVIELEPAVSRFAELCSSVNAGVLTDLRVNHVVGDGREFLLTTDGRYDVIFSEPSNPYRAGIASFYSQDFYRAVRQRLTDDGIFLQWLQSYEVDGRTVRTVLKTMASTFDSVEAWEVFTKGDLVLVASNRPIDHDLARLRQRVRDPAIRDAMRVAWGVDGVEGFYSGFVASSALADAVRDAPGAVNTDARPVLEFDFARKVGHRIGFSIAALRELARDHDAGRPKLVNGALNWETVGERRLARATYEAGLEVAVPEPSAAAQARNRARRSYLRGDLAGAGRRWLSQSDQPLAEADLLLVAHALAASGDERALPLIERLRETRPVEAGLIAAILDEAGGRLAEATAALVAAFGAWQTDPWPPATLMRHGLRLATTLARRDPALAEPLFDAIGGPIAIEMLWEERHLARIQLAERAGGGRLCVDAFAAFEPNIPWNARSLELRARCYEAAGEPRAAQARRDHEAFKGRAAADFWD